MCIRGYLLVPPGVKSIHSCIFLYCQGDVTRLRGWIPEEEFKLVSSESISRQRLVNVNSPSALVNSVARVRSEIYGNDCQ